MPTRNRRHTKNPFSQTRKAFFLSGISAFLVSCSGSGQKADPNFNAAIAHPAFVNTHPKVLFDEAHRNFHTSTGRYKPFVQLLLADGYQVAPNKEKFSQQSLKGYNILVISNAKGMQVKYDPAFTEPECEAVRDWVNSGGALLLIADHYPMGSAAENLSRRFGVGMSNSYGVEDSRNCVNPSGDNTQLVFSRENRLLVDCPVTRGRDSSERIEKVVSFTGQSLSVPDGSIPFLLLSQTAHESLVDSVWTEKSVLSTKIFTQFEEIPVSAAGKAQAIAIEFGSGRVVILGEAAMLTAQIDGQTGKPFGMNVPGNDNQQFALNIMHWLSRLLN